MESYSRFMKHMNTQIRRMQRELMLYLAST